MLNLSHFWNKKVRILAALQAILWKTVERASTLKTAMPKTLLIALVGLLVACSKTETTETEEIKQFFANISDRGFPKDKPFVLIDKFDAKEWKNDFKQWASIDSVLSGKQIDFLVQKVESSPPVVWKSEDFRNAKVVARNYLDTITRTEPFILRPSLYSFSRPYFTRDKEYCIMYFDVYCGLLCAEESINVYKNENGKWILIRRYVTSVS